MSRYHIRPYIPGQDDWLLTWGGEHTFQELGVDETFNAPHFLDTWRLCIETKTGQVFMLEHDGCVKGAVGVVLYPDIFTGLIVASLVFWFLLPELRGTLAASRLFSQYIKYAESSHSHRLAILSIGRFHNEIHLEPYLRRLGFKRSGQLYTRDL